MGRILCNKHGRQGIVEICYHLHDIIYKQNKGVPWDAFKEIKISYEDIDPKLNQPEDCSVHYFCHQCVEKYGLPVEQPISFDDRDGIYQEAFKRVGIICVKCLKESFLKKAF